MSRNPYILNFKGTPICNMMYAFKKSFIKMFYCTPLQSQYFVCITTIIFNSIFSVIIEYLTLAVPVGVKG